jgi:crossover junction endodeoxyribonuclease RusA
VSRSWRLELPHVAPPLTLNQRLHWAAANRIKRQLAVDVGWLLVQQRVPALDHASIWLEWTPVASRRRDSDNLEPTRKTVIDAIVSAGLLPDDTSEYVTRPENLIHPPTKHLPGLRLVVVIAEDRYVTVPSTKEPIA